MIRSAKADYHVLWKISHAKATKKLLT